ncbi:hypothetical protein BGZ65_010592, partial [Modicella reniformis]
MTSTLEVGRISKCLDNFKTSMTLPLSLDELRVDIADTMLQMTRLRADLLRIGTLAVQHFVAQTMAEYPTVADAGTRKAAFSPLLTGQSFFVALMVELYRPKGRKKNPVADSVAGANVAKCFEISFGAELQSELSRVKTYLQGHVSRSYIEYIARELSDSIRTHANHYISELMARVTACAPGWATSTEGRAVLSSINSKGQSLTHDPLSLCWLLNAVLPEDARIALFPMSSWKDGYATLSETYLYEGVTRQRGGQEQPFVESYKTLFGAEDQFTENRGQMFKLLFLGGKNNYCRQGAVASSAFELSRYESTIDKLQTTSATDSSYAEAKTSFKNQLQEDLLSHIEPSNSETPPCPKFILTGTLSTDGYQVKIHAYHLRHPKRDKRASPAQASSSSALETYTKPQPSSGKSRISHIPYLRDGIPDASAVLEHFPDLTSFVVTGIDPGVKKTATA